MASNSGWDKTVPSGTSLINVGDDDIRSLKSSMQAWWEDEHYATDGSANSAGVHKLGSARAYVGTASQLSNPEQGRFFWATDGAQLYLAPSSSSWSQIAGVAADAANTFTATQTFSSGITASDLTMSGSISRVSTADLAVGGGASIVGAPSGSTTLAANQGANSGEGFLVTLKNTDSSVTFSDPIFVGFQKAADADSWLATGTVLSNRSVQIYFQNETVSRRTINAGTTIRYVVFRF